MIVRPMKVSSNTAFPECFIKLFERERSWRKMTQVVCKYDEIESSR